jgi:hypothetical protein
MCKYFSISGYWKDDKSEFYGYIVKEFDDSEENEEDDDKIFFYGLSENDIKQAIEEGEEGTAQEFVITSYEEIDF